MYSCRHPSFKCFARFLYKQYNYFLKDPNEIHVTDFLVLKRNAENFTNLIEENLLENQQARSEGFVQNFLDALNTEATKYFITHTVELKIPRFLISGTELDEVGRSGEVVLDYEVMPKGTGFEMARIFKKKISMF